MEQKPKEQESRKPIRQERHFQPTGDIKDDFDFEDDEVVSEDTASDSSDSEDKDPDEIEMKKKLDIKKLLPIILAVAVLFLIVVIVLSKSMKDKKQQELEEHADELLEPDTAMEEELFQYTDDEVEALREAGYTGYEIDDFEFNEVDAQSLINEAAEKRKAMYEQELVPYLDSASEEFKDLKNKTWLCLDNFEIPSDTESWQYEQENYNVDYEKIGSRGLQCFIKFYLEDGGVGFTTVTPERYVTLADKGNMVLNIKYCIMSNGNKVIVSAEEVRIEQ